MYVLLTVIVLSSTASELNLQATLCTSCMQAVHAVPSHAADLAEDSAATGQTEFASLGIDKHVNMIAAAIDTTLQKLQLKVGMHDSTLCCVRCGVC